MNCSTTSWLAHHEYLKRRIKDFDKYFPSRRPEPDLESVRRWLQTYAWTYQMVHDGLIPQAR